MDDSFFLLLRTPTPTPHSNSPIHPTPSFPKTVFSAPPPKEWHGVLDP